MGRIDRGMRCEEEGGVKVKEIGRGRTFEGYDGLLLLWYLRYLSQTSNLNAYI